MGQTVIELIENSEGRQELWQWDLGRKVKVIPADGITVDEVHFGNVFSGEALVVEPKVDETTGDIVANVPNILITQFFRINVYAVMVIPDGKITTERIMLDVEAREKPSDYVYKETEIKNYDALEKRIEELEKNGGGSGETWRTIREFDILNEEGIANDNSGITWTVDDSGNITAFEFDTDADGQTLSANKLRWCICPLDYQSNNAQAIFGGKRGYLHTYCNIKNNTFYSGTIYNATNTISSYRLESVIESDMSGILRQTTYSGCDGNSYGNDKVQFNFFTIGGQGYAKPPIQKFKIACDTGIWFVKGAKVLVQVCEEVG